MLTIQVINDKLEWRKEAENRNLAVEPCCCIVNEKKYCYDADRLCCHLVCRDSAGEKVGIYRIYSGYGFLPG